MIWSEAEASGTKTTDLAPGSGLAVTIAGGGGGGHLGLILLLKHSASTSWSDLIIIY